jgi:hypothetical protein
MEVREGEGGTWERPVEEGSYRGSYTIRTSAATLVSLAAAKATSKLALVQAQVTSKIALAEAQATSKAVASQCKIAPLPKCSSEMQKAWDTRSAVFKEFSVGHLRLQERFLFLLEVGAEKRILWFKRLAEERRWAPGTKATYWANVCGMMSVLGGKASPAELKYQKQVEAAAAAATPSNRPSLSVEGMQKLWSVGHELCLPMAVAWTLGQRVSDVLLLRPVDVSVKGTYVVLTFRRGKVIAHIGPYVLFLSHNSVLGKAIWTLSESKSTNREQLLWEDDKEVIRLLLAEVGMGDRRCLRRGGLQRMAEMGLSVEELLSFSKHREVKCLMKYLEHGASVMRLADLQSLATSKMQSEALGIPP